MKIFSAFIISFILGFAQIGLTQPAVTSDDSSEPFNTPVDSTQVAKKYFSEGQILELKTNPDFNYKEPPSAAESIWDRFIQWIGQFFGALFEGATNTNWGRILVYAAAFVGFIIVLLMILRVNAFRVFYSGADKGTIASAAFHENIHEMDFEKLIHEAMERKKYREGIRLIFLHALKLLTDKQLIHWQAGKTNHDYVSELSTGDLKSNLTELSFYFDYAWYGNFIVKEDAFNKTQQIFQSLKQKAG